MTKTLVGVVQGKSIQFSEGLGVPEGVSVRVTFSAAEPSHQWGEGIRKSAGAWQKYPEVEQALERIQQDRKIERREQGL